MRTADDVIKDWEVIQSGRTRWVGQELRDDEIMLAEVLQLRVENADMRGAANAAVAAWDSESTSSSFVNEMMAILRAKLYSPAHTDTPCLRESTTRTAATRQEGKP